jgi:lipopolysaccharide/colanic/teichoic acid biosynthesis glycosyltransferase
MEEEAELSVRADEGTLPDVCVAGFYVRHGKRALDLALGGILAIVTLPVVALAAALIVLETPGPVFYRQRRVGFRGKDFDLIKLRTMRDGAENGTGPVWAAENDPRVTRVGRFLRLTRMDELPQFWLVLTGAMSLVGPRPERPELEALIVERCPSFRRRHAVRPGVTGMAQVRYRYGASLKDARIKFNYDSLYLRRVSLLLDFRILAETARVVLGMRGSR